MTHRSFSFLTATEIQFGRGASAGAAQRVAALGRSVCLVHGATAVRAAWLQAALAEEGLSVVTFACPKEPDVALVEAGVETARAAGAEVIVSLGGGAVIDCGKAIAALVPARRPMLDHLEVVGRGMPLDEAPLPFVALPTTSGTGAEVTKNAVIGVPEARRKVSLRDNRMLPDLAIVDPALTDNAPRVVTLASGLDAVTQVIEPYISSKANRLTDALCRDAIPLGVRALYRLMQEEDPGARDDLAWVSLCGGLALANSGLGAVHGLAGPMGGVAPAPHGAICGALLPHVLQANADALGAAGRARINEVFAVLGEVLGTAPSVAPARLSDWARSCGLPRLSEMGVQEDDLPAIAEAAGGSSSMRGNPVPLDAQTLVSVMKKAF